MYVESVSMTDFRCFEKAETTFVPFPGSGSALTGGIADPRDVLVEFEEQLGEQR